MTHTKQPPTQARTRRKPQRRKPVAIPPLPGQQLLNFDNLLALGIRYSRQHLYRLMETGDFPRPVALASGRSARVAWDAAAVHSWIAERTGKAV